ncbi:MULTISPECIES: Shedu anti-phage system protein SduA domain-containing protein [Stutzerimonas]|uniref:Shedu anti-phage system protein SduA domain-containing protein n=1 Tax=Stutzerimonas TaxID=2901164 RepID=UPI001F440E3D|nr:Shedu anti-phage system protein SduA domain-containing protein [Stutzerimonas kunmingensis]UIP34198.1 DUF4263 domain-containing protein [Stutzerimonas kunmingensis]
MDDGVFEKVMRTINLSKDLRGAKTGDAAEISDALALKLSNHFDPEDIGDVEEELEQLLGSIDEESRAYIVEVLGDTFDDSQIHQEKIRNPEFARVIQRIFSAKKCVADIIEYVRDYEPDNEAGEFAAKCLSAFAEVNALLLERDVVPLLRRGIYSEDIKSAIAVWHSNSESKATDEEFWQTELSARKGILERLIGGYAVFLQREFHVGSTNVEGKGSKRSDFAMVDRENRNLSLVEIKTPSTKLVGAEYRGTHPLSQELSGTVSQIMIQRNEILQNFYQKRACSDTVFEVFAPRCFIIAGSLKSLGGDKNKIKAFEIQRQVIAPHVTIVTFDELYHQFATFHQV